MVRESNLAASRAFSLQRDERMHPRLACCIVGEEGRDWRRAEPQGLVSLGPSPLLTWLLAASSSSSCRLGVVEIDRPATPSPPSLAFIGQLKEP